jgi:hypothetical protein
MVETIRRGEWTSNADLLVPNLGRAGCVYPDISKKGRMKVIHLKTIMAKLLGSCGRVDADCVRPDRSYGDQFGVSLVSASDRLECFLL